MRFFDSASAKLVPFEYNRSFEVLSQPPIPQQTLFCKLLVSVKIFLSLSFYPNDLAITQFTEAIATMRVGSDQISG